MHCKCICADFKFGAICCAVAWNDFFDSAVYPLPGADSLVYDMEILARQRPSLVLSDLYHPLSCRICVLFIITIDSYTCVYIFDDEHVSAVNASSVATLSAWCMHT
jgi:hypothetical protein